MRRFISFNRQILPAEKAFFPAAAAAALFGKGIFTTVAIHDSVPFLWEKHWRRLCENAAQVGINLNGFSETKTRNLLIEIVGINYLVRGRARLTFFDEATPAVWQNSASPKINLLIQTAEPRAIPETLRLTVSPFRVNSRSPLVGVKSCNYWENIMAFEKAQADGFDEAIRLNERDEIVSACLANVFWKRNGAIYTPPLETGCLRGTTRDFVMEKFSVEERTASLEEIYDADEIFLTSAGIGIVNADVA